MSSSDIADSRTKSADVSATTSALVAKTIAPALKRVDISQILAKSGVAGSIGVGRIELGQATIERVAIQGVNARLEAGSTQLEGVRGVIRIIATLAYRVLLADRTASAEFRFPFSIGNVVIPNLDNINVNIPSATLSDARIGVEPILNLDLGGGQFTDLRIDGTHLPAAGFGLDGIALGNVMLRDVSVPATFTSSLSIGSFAPVQPLRLPNTVLAGLQLPDVDVPHVSSGAPISIPSITPVDVGTSVGFDLILLSVRLSLRPVVDIEISALTIKDIEAFSSVQRIAIEDIRAPVTLHDFRLGELELREVTINQITV
ncbi:hypothetical protein [Rubellimicrobium arenae]|uniref:hypothetical protein n=1 Tax=Rubellimicrobium arenae TaxID=2817372 RepID=UPI001B311672|nr:hypothetical protein [Rubellimicrobium arenae]